MPTRKRCVKSVFEEEKAVPWEQSFVSSADLYRRLGVPRKAPKTLILKAYLHIQDTYADMLDDEGRRALRQAVDCLTDKKTREQLDALYLNTNGELPEGAPCWRIESGKIHALGDDPEDRRPTGSGKS